MTAPTWLPTARALAEVWDGPPLAQFVVSEGEAVFRCGYCGASDLAPDDKCCSADPNVGGTVVESHPNRDTVPDLDSNAVGGEVYAALCELAAESVDLTFHEDGKPESRHTVIVDRELPVHAAPHAAEALALAYVAVR